MVTKNSKHNRTRYTKNSTDTQESSMTQHDVHKCIDYILVTAHTHMLFEEINPDQNILRHENMLDLSNNKKKRSVFIQRNHIVRLEKPL